ncbi:MAG TPA: protein kinase [Bacteroidota bacterium]|nr:protein kinase [Bacteroidota bacterium]
MIGQTISHYKILEKLGEGGMGVVYKAEDTKLKRLVALKFLPQNLTSNEIEKARFLQEAQAASALNHANVCIIHDIQEHEGTQFIVMEYVDGVTLRRKIPIQKVADALAYAIQIGEALQEAHGRGIVHRDIKSDNIMVSSKNQIKVMDFGLAKLKGSLKLTRTSSTVGTLAYMAPEQIQGGEVDARSDIFSFGIVLYEMLTGRTPFSGEHEAAIMYSILNEEPGSVLKYRPEISPEFDRIIRRALEKDPEDRYQHTDDMTSEIKRIQKQSTRVVRPDTQPAASHLSPPPAVSMSSVPLPDNVPGTRSRRTLLFALAGAIVVVAALSILVLRRPSPTAPPASDVRKMLVVLPFENLGSADQEYFAEGITEEITSRLSGLSGLGVIARTSAMQYKKSTKSLKQIGEELGVGYILQGTIRWESADGTSRVRVNPQLISVADGTQMWSQPSEAVLASAFKLQSDIAAQVASALNLTLLQREKQSLEAKVTENSEAYDYYLRGTEYLYRSTEERDYRIAEQMFQKAVDLDPKFVAAFAKLGAIHSHIYWEFYDHTEERVQKSKLAAEKALELDPNSPEAHGAMGWYYYHCLRNYSDAMKEFHLALQAQPNNTDVLLGLGAIDRRLGKFDEAVTYFKRIVEIDPRSPSMTEDLALTHVPIRKYADAEQYFDRAIRLAPDWEEPYYMKADVCLLLDGDVSKAKGVLDEAVRQKVGQRDPSFLYYSVIIEMVDGKYAKVADLLESKDVTVFDQQYWYVPKDILLGQLNGYLNRSEKEHSHYDAARALLEHEIQKHPDDPRLHSSLGIAYAGLGRKDDAIREGKHAVDLMPASKEAVIGPLRLQDLAQICVMAGDQDLAIDQLEKLLSMPSWVSRSLLRIDPAWKPLQNNARFQKLVAENK